MSIESMAIALHHSKAKGAAKLVLMGIANHDGDGGAWPSLATLAKYANVQDLRYVRRVIGELITLGEVSREMQAGGTLDTPDWQRPNLYRFLLTCPEDCDRSANHRPITEGRVNRPGEGPQTPGGRVHRPSKPSSKPLTTDKRTTYVPERAREATCETTGQPHRINRKLRYCADCLTPTALLDAPPSRISRPGDTTTATITSPPANSTESDKPTRSPAAPNRKEGAA